MVRSRSKPTKVLRHSQDVSLLLVCESEELSPAQKADQKRKQQAYTAFMRQLDEYRAKGAVIEFLKTPLTPAEIVALESKPVVSVEEHVTGTVIPAGAPIASEHRAQQRPVGPVTPAQTYVPVALAPARVTPLVIRTPIQHQNAGSGNKKGKPSVQKDAKPSNRPQRRAAKAAIGLINDTIDVDEQLDDDDDVIIVNESMARALPPDGRAKAKGRGKTMSPTSPVLGIQQSVANQSKPATPQLHQITQPTSLRHVEEEFSDVGPVGLKMGLSMQESAAQAKRKQKKTDDEQGSWVPLDEYYYGKKEGDPAYREEKGEYRFKCWYCHKMLYNNLRIMMHMQGHIDSEKQQNLDLADLTQCKHCYKQFDTPFEMQNHIEKVHQTKFNVLVCRICEKDHDNQVYLRHHMKASHNACEMPYICQLCNFRSSVYTDVVDHFKKRHDSSQYVLCLYCLKMFKVAFSKATGWGLTQNYYQHLQKHQAKVNSKKCPCCKLTFINKLDVKIHRQRDHLPNFRGAIFGSGSRGDDDSDIELVMIKLPTDNKNPKVKSLNAPVATKVQEVRALRFTGVGVGHRCRECGQNMQSADHFRRYVECSLCRYATTCNNAYSAHMMNFHSGKSANRRRSVPKERLLTKPWYCLCGYKSRRGNGIANHLVICSKRTAYVAPPEQKFFEYDDEQEEFNPFEPYEDDPSTADKPLTPEKEVPSLFGALGLVRKPEKPTFTKKDANTGDVVMVPAQPVATVSKSVKKTQKGMKQSEKASRTKSPIQAESLDDIPPELTGAQKWSTVKINDDKAPTKASVFLGSEDKKPEQSHPVTKTDTKETEVKAYPAGSESLTAEVVDAKPEVATMETSDGKDETQTESAVTEEKEPMESAETGDLVEQPKALQGDESLPKHEATDPCPEDEGHVASQMQEKEELPEPGADTAETELTGEGITEKATAREPEEQEDEVTDEVMLLEEGDVKENTEEGSNGVVGYEGNSNEKACAEEGVEGTDDECTSDKNMEGIDEAVEAEDDGLEVEHDGLEAKDDDLEAKPDDLEAKPDDLEVKPDDLEVKNDDLEVNNDDYEVKDDCMEDENEDDNKGSEALDNTEINPDMEVTEEGISPYMEVTEEGMEAESLKADNVDEKADEDIMNEADEQKGGDGDNESMEVTEAVEDVGSEELDDESSGKSEGKEESEEEGKAEVESQAENEEIIAESEGNIAETEENVSENERNVAESEGNVAESEGNVAESEENVAEIEENVAENERNVAESEGNVAESEGNVAESEENVAEIEENVAESEGNIGESGENIEESEDNEQTKENEQTEEKDSKEIEENTPKSEENLVESKEAADSVKKLNDNVAESEGKVSGEAKEFAEKTSDSSSERPDKQPEKESKEEKTSSKAEEHDIIKPPEKEKTQVPPSSTGQGKFPGNRSSSSDTRSTGYRDNKAPDSSRSPASSFRSPDRSSSSHSSYGQHGRQGGYSDSSRSHDRDNRRDDHRRDDYSRHDQRQSNYDRDRSYDRNRDDRYRQDYRDNRQQGGYNQNRDRYGGGYNQRGGQRGGGGRGGYYDNYRGRGRGGYQGQGGYGGGYQGHY